MTPGIGFVGLGHMGSALAAHLVAVGSRPGTIGGVTSEIWDRFAAAEPGVDVTRICPFIEDGA